MITGERDLITAAGACTVNRSNRRNLERSQAIENALAFRDEGAHFPGHRLAQQGLQISARNKDRFLGRSDDHSLERRVVLDGSDVIAQIFERGRVKNVRARIRPIEGQHANSIGSDFAANH